MSVCLSVCFVVVLLALSHQSPIRSSHAATPLQACPPTCTSLLVAMSNLTWSALELLRFVTTSEGEPTADLHAAFEGNEVILMMLAIGFLAAAGTCAACCCLISCLDTSVVRSAIEMDVSEASPRLRRRGGGRVEVLRSPSQGRGHQQVWGLPEQGGAVSEKEPCWKRELLRLLNVSVVIGIEIQDCLKSPLCGKLFSFCLKRCCVRCLGLSAKGLAAHAEDAPKNMVLLDNLDRAEKSGLLFAADEAMMPLTRREREKLLHDARARPNVAHLDPWTAALTNYFYTLTSMCALRGVELEHRPAQSAHAPPPTDTVLALFQPRALRAGTPLSLRRARWTRSSLRWTRRRARRSSSRGRRAASRTRPTMTRRSSRAF